MAERGTSGPERRSVRAFTRRGSVDGHLLVQPGASTLHSLNAVAERRSFLMLHGPVCCEPPSAFDGSVLAIAPDAILCVVELSEWIPRRGDAFEAGRFRRCPVRLQLADLVVDGFAHVPQGTNALERLDHDRHPFFALTSVSAVGPHSHVTAPFMAIHRRHVELLQRIDPVPADDTEAAIDLEAAD